MEEKLSTGDDGRFDGTSQTVVAYAIFDATDDVGIILDTCAGVYFNLNVTATIMLQATLACETVIKSS